MSVTTLPLDLPADVWDLIFKHLNLNELNELSCCNKELNNYIHEFARDNASKAHQNSSSQILWTVLRKNFAENNLLDKKLVGIASSVIGVQASALGQTVEILSDETLKISASGTKLITLHSFAQATYLYTHYKYEANYNSFWAALRVAQSGLPDLKGRHAISTWLKDPQNQAVLGSITSLTITGPEFNFFPPEAKSRLTALQFLYFSDCTSLQMLNFEGCQTLQRVFFTNCTSLQELNLKDCPALNRILDCSNCISLQKLNLQGCSALTTLICSSCTLLEYLNLEDCTSLQSLFCANCTSLRLLNLRQCSALKVFTCHGCTSFQIVDFEDCLALDTLDCYGCTSLQPPDFRNCSKLRQLDCRGCILFQSLDLRGCPLLYILDRSNYTVIYQVPRN